MSVGYVSVKPGSLEFFESTLSCGSFDRIYHVDNTRSFQSKGPSSATHRKTHHMVYLSNKTKSLSASLSFSSSVISGPVS